MRPASLRQKNNTTKVLLDSTDLHRSAQALLLISRVMDEPLLNENSLFFYRMTNLHTINETGKQNDKKVIKKYYKSGKNIKG